MDFKSKKQSAVKVLFILMLSCSFCVMEGQQTPLSPISYWIFSPYIYNPAIAGSKDFLSIGINAAFQGESNTQLISGNSRISKTKSGYFTSPDITEFRNLGIGGSLFRDVNGLNSNIGLSLSCSYQIPLTTRKLSFISLGISVKGVSNSIDLESIAPGAGSKRTFYPDLDLGIYYYGTNFFTGLSTVNILGNPVNIGSLAGYKLPVTRLSFFTAGYKILVSKSLNIVLEPSFLVSVNDSTFSNIKDNINPILKLYLDDFCFGTAYRSDGKISFFAQFRYPKFYVGAYYELAKKTPYFKKNPLVEFTFGINIQPDKSRLSNHSRW
jgi:type IX secretion system PorP/SprF family membrane protein